MEDGTLLISNAQLSDIGKIFINFIRFEFELIISEFLNLNLSKVRGGCNCCCQLDDTGPQPFPMWPQF